jgi:hypothetical protein
MAAAVSGACFRSFVEHCHSHLRSSKETKDISKVFATVDGNERIQFWNSILVAYGTIYQSNTNLCWTLLAYLAGHLAMLPLIKGFWVLSRNDLVDDEVKELIVAFFLGNFGIFDDIAWVHYLYLDGGVTAIEAVKEFVPYYLLSGFRLIEFGRASNNRQVIVEGNALLVDQEQILTLTPIFEQFPRGLRFFGSLGLEFPAMFHASARQLGIDIAWPSDCPSYGPVLPRLSFLRDGNYRAFLHWLETRPEEAKGALARRVDPVVRYQSQKARL